MNPMNMKLYHDEDASLEMLDGLTIAVVGYGNQGRAQALNLRDSGLTVIVGNREDTCAEQALRDGFDVHAIGDAVIQADVVLLLIPDEIAPAVYATDIAQHMDGVSTLCFASGYNCAYGLFDLPNATDVVLVAPRMIGAGVRDLYVSGAGFPSFIGVHRDHSGRAREMALALAKGIGSTRAGVVQVTFAQEAELDLFTEQCFGPAFGHVLTSAVNLLLDEGYPPEAVLLELYMSGEFSYTLAKIAELGMVEQARLHSQTSQYGSMSRGVRFMLPEIRQRMEAGLREIRSGAFAAEWAAEQEAGYPTLSALREAAQSLPLYQLEMELRQQLRAEPITRSARSSASTSSPPLRNAASPKLGTLRARKPRPATPSWWRRLVSGRGEAADAIGTTPLGPTQMSEVLLRFLAALESDATLRQFSRGRDFSAIYELTDSGQSFFMAFRDGVVRAGLVDPEAEAEVRLQTTSDTLDGMLSGRTNAVRAAMSGKLVLGGDTRLAMSIQQVQNDLSRLYRQARDRVVG